MALKHQKLFIHDHINSREHSEVYLSEPSPAGQLFILLESQKNKVDQSGVLDQIINAAVTYFDTNQGKGAEELLEEILQELNTILPQIGSNIHIKNWLNSLDLVVGIMDSAAVHMAGIGNLNAVLFSKGKTSPILEKSETVNPNKIFSDIISGSLDQGDALVISSNALFDYISKEKIKQIINKYSPQSAALQLSDLLHSVPDFVTFNSLIIKRPALSDKEIAKPVHPEEDEGNFFDDDEMAMTPVEKGHKVDYHKPRTKTVVDLKAIANTKTGQRAAKVGKSVSGVFKGTAKAVGAVGKGVKGGIKFTASKDYRKEKEEETLDKIEDKVNKKVYWFSKLSLKKKIALVTLLVIAVAFVQSLVFLTQQSDAKQKEENYRQAIIDINSKLSEVEAKLIYDDEEAAEDLLLQIQSLIEDAPAISEEHQAELDMFAERVARQLNKVRHINDVPSPLEIIDTSATISSASQIVQKEGVFYVLDDKSDQSALYKVVDDKLEKLVDLPGGLIMTDWPDEDRLVLANNSEYFIYEIEANSFESYNFSKAAGNDYVQDIVIYADNLYVLDPQASQIFKYSESGNSFGGGSLWLTENSDLSSGSSLTIDGSIYTIDDSGTIKMYTRGELDSFSQRQPRPEIGSGPQIKTFRDSDYLYIIDPDNNRVIIMNKDGDIIDQFTSDKFDNLTDLAIDPDEKAIYLLNGSHIYLLAINQEE